MATKRYNEKRFTFMVNGVPVAMTCDTTYTRDGFCHHAFLYGFGRYQEHTRVKYYNRTWERFTYESVLHAAVRKLPKEYRAPLELEIDTIATDAAAKVDAFLQAFRRNYGALSDEQKDFLRAHTPHLETSEQAQAVAGMVALMAATR